MHAPEPWPYADLEAWRDWRTHLDDAQDPNVATLKREADCGITPDESGFGAISDPSARQAHFETPPVVQAA